MNKPLLILLLCCVSLSHLHGQAAPVQGCTAGAQALTVSCNLTGVGANHLLLMYTYSCGASCFQPLTSDISITASDTLGGGLTWTSPASGTQHYGSTAVGMPCSLSGGACVVKEQAFYATTGASSGNDTLTFTISFLGTVPACNCADLRISVIEVSGVTATPFDTSNGTASSCNVCGSGNTALTDGTITLPSGTYAPTVTIVNGGTANDQYTIMFLAFRGTDGKDILFASSSCTNCGGYVTQAGWTREAGSAAPVNNADDPEVYYQLSAANGGIRHKSQVY